MNIVSVSLVCTLTAVICRVLAKESGEFSSALSICTVVIVCALIMYSASDILYMAERLYESSFADEKYFDIMI